MTHRFRRGLLALAPAVALAVPGVALGQGAPVYQSGVITPHSLPKVGSQGRVMASGGLAGDAQGRGVNPFSITSDGLGLCINSDVTTGAYKTLCLGYDASGNGILSINSVGGAAAASLSISINGTPVDLDFSSQLVDFDNVGAVATTDFALPAASAIAPTRCYAVDAAQLLRVTAAAGERIAVGATLSATGGTVASDTPHSSICLHARKAGQWVARSITGSWVVN